MIGGDHFSRIGPTAETPAPRGARRHNVVRAPVFLAVFGVAAVPPTGAALFFLRPYRSFWRALSVAALTIAVTGLAAFIEYVAARTAAAGSILHVWSWLAVLRILAAPLFAVAFLLSGLFAPNRSYRIALLVSTLIEAVAFAYVALTWLRPQ